MEYKEFSELLEEKAKKIEIKLQEQQIEEFYQYMLLLIEWNKVMNLTTIIEPKEIIIKHFIDSITMAKYMEDEKNIVDIGTGAGFPGIPLAIIKKDANYTLVDSLNKRIHFLEEVVKAINLKNIVTVHERAEEFGAKNKEKFDMIASRAVASLPVLLEYMLPVLKIGGKAICMKGFNIEEEIETASKALRVLGGEIEKIEKFELPDTDMQRSIIIIRKVAKTPVQFPRKAGTPAKEPIC